MQFLVARPFLAFAMTLGIVVSLGLARNAVHHEPAFYEAALAVTPQQQKEAGDRMERRVLELHNDLHHRGRWEARFSEDDINGWLGYALPEKFGHVVSLKEVEEPRVAIKEGVLQFACKYEGPKARGVLSLDLEAGLTDDPNVLAVRICRARLGVVPLPLRHFLDRIARLSQRTEIPLRWKQQAGDPVALIEIPKSHADYARQEILLDTVQLRDGELYISGRTEEGRLNRTAQAESPDRWVE